MVSDRVTEFDNNCVKEVILFTELDRVNESDSERVKDNNFCEKLDNVNELEIARWYIGRDFILSDNVKD